MTHHAAMTPPRFWAPLTARLGLSDRAAREAWNAIGKSHDAKVVAWAYHARRFDDALGSPGEDVHIDAFLTGTWAPKALCTVLETLVAEERLPRQDVSQWQEQVLRLTNAKGAWVSTTAAP